MSTITVSETANAAEAIYYNHDFPGFTLKGGFFDPKNDNRLGWHAKGGDEGGGSVGLYNNNSKSNEFLIAFRGSKGGKDWLVDDRQILLTITADRANDCLQWTRNTLLLYPHASFLVTGHSLGGYLAQVVGAELGLPFITYNAPPAGNIRNGSAFGDYKSGMNLRIDWDPVSRSVGKHYGRLMTLPHVGLNIADAHTNKAIQKSMAKASFKHLPAVEFIRMWI